MDTGIGSDRVFISGYCSVGYIMLAGRLGACVCHYTSSMLSYIRFGVFDLRMWRTGSYDVMLSSQE